MEGGLPDWRGAWRVREAHFPLEIGFVRPRRTAAISLTGFWCALDCAHCGGRYLRGMMPAWQADVAAATSCLISGGCDAQGRVPVERYLEKVREWRVGRRMNWHVGLIGEEQLARIAPLVDVVSFDFVGDEATIREVYGLPYAVSDYVRVYQMLRERVPVVPHITIGLRGGRISGEYRALELLQQLGATALVFLVLIPTKGTAFQDRQPPPPAEVAQVLIAARLAFPSTPIYLGCMRPAGRYREEIDAIAVRAGLNKIVNPARSAISLAAQMGLRLLWEEECCVF